MTRPTTRARHGNTKAKRQGGKKGQEKDPSEAEKCVGIEAKADGQGDVVAPAIAGGPRRHHASPSHPQTLVPLRTLCPFSAGCPLPPSPSLTTHTFAVYSAAAYDRSPIVVSPNSLALPERGCPGRTYTLDEPSPSSPKRGHPYGGRDLHPRALAFNASRQRLEDAARASSLLPPPLIPDLSSESDESDGFSSPAIQSYTPTIHIHGLAIPQDRCSTYASFDVDPYAVSPISPSALSFLPHAPSSPSRSPYAHGLSICDDPPTPKPKRRRERKHDASRTPDRIPDAPDTLSYCSPTKIKSSKRVSALSKSLSARHAESGFRIEDDGCLGGF
ncbi:hypothetical protein D9615_007718 [Tricholomella constricta]|uniref:Uncharacterized protein n=1 Tax=Tricholomella constricta TaxID=117010 RepID=A0A8H5H336_9AGAR|nr:hypothetical protein D9615_007718 [Tricholomella constricta]